MTPLSRAARAYISLVVLAGAWFLGRALGSWQSDDPIRFGCYAAVAGLASTLKVQLPAISGTMSVSYLFILIGTVELSYAETLAIACGSVLLQTFWHAKKRPTAVHVLFNVSSVAGLSAPAAYYSFHALLPHFAEAARPALLALTATIFFVANTLPVAGVISLTEGKPVRRTWHECYFWSYPHYLAGASVVWLLNVLNRYAGWQASLGFLPLVYFVYRSYLLYIGRLADEKKHVTEMAELHLRTIEALALAIDAKDHTTHHHLCRVQVYAIEIGKEMGLTGSQLEALRAASLLHDIGKLAVPEHVISKPGKLTPEEFDKVKIHPVVGAEILERVKFPYPVAPIVRAHHERWDGTGYPDGLAGENIPIGARILSAVDCLDALASDRQYRRALPLPVAMETIASQSGKSFDPGVVAVLRRRYIELDRLAQEQRNRSRIAEPVRTASGGVPAAGYADHRAGSGSGLLPPAAALRRKARVLRELTQDLDRSLSLNEKLSVLAARLKRVVPHDAFAVYLRRERCLTPEYVNGEDCRLFASLAIPLGEGVSGWVAANRSPVLNANAAVEPGYLADPSVCTSLQSALSIPLEGSCGLLGVLTLYHADRDAFTTDELWMLLAISYKVALSIEDALAGQERLRCEGAQRDERATAAGAGAMDVSATLVH